MIKKNYYCLLMIIDDKQQLLYYLKLRIKTISDKVVLSAISTAFVVK
jgi:hypothetical protein